MASKANSRTQKKGGHQRSFDMSQESQNKSNLLPYISGILCSGDAKNLVEPVWLRTNKYICNLLNKRFFSSESLNPTVPLRLEFARFLVLDFGDAWVAKCSLGSCDEVTMTVPRSAKLTTRIDPF
ncbi:hypothetical protein O181_111758 [Austropuccinia psidii MF-1]|uniref:Uncharacterized protein n=1 Tax=Austropuccinia psidii MF-1 TaxID=1389203 RepID=A0A9Q3PS10_9BASI|nr:hypothetical protein [Austropuccinia psidii MF-1]